MIKFVKITLLAIVSILVLAVIGLFVFGPGLIKDKAEPILTEANGAEVNIDGINMSLVPLGFSVEKVQATNPNKPSENVVSVKDVSAEFSVLPLLDGTFQIDILNVDNLHFNSKRESPGKVIRATQADDSMSIEDIKQAMLEQVDSDNLITVQRYRALEKSQQEQKVKVKQAIDSLPNQEQLEQYKAQIEALKEKANLKNIAGIKQLKEDFDALKKSIRADKDKIKGAKQAIATAKETLSNDFKQLKQAPNQDWQRFSSQYQIDRVAELMLGAEQSEWLKSLLAPKEQAVEPEVAKTAPSFIIKQGLINVQWADKRIAIDLENITADNYLTKENSKWNIRSLSESIKASGGGWFFVKQDGVTTENKWDLKGLALNSIDVNQSDAMSVLLKAANLATSGSFSMKEGKLDGDIAVGLLQPLFELVGEAEWIAPLQKALNSKEKIDFNYLLSMQGDDIVTKLKSNIDNLVADIIKEGAANKAEQYKDEYMDKIKTKYVKDLDLEQMFGGDVNQLDSLEQQLEALLKEKLPKNKLLKGIF